MRINALDHVNIVTPSLEDTAVFYARLLGLERRDAPPPLTPADAQWLYAADGRAVIHVNTPNAPRTWDSDTTGRSTGPLHHIAFDCTGHEEMLSRLYTEGVEHRCNTVTAIGLRQIFCRDPNGILLELNFRGD